MRVLLNIAICLAFLPTIVSGRTVGKWRQFRLEYVDSTWKGNPFDLKFQADFRHTASGAVLRQFGFYAGANTWKIHFMPNREGGWTYKTHSEDTELNGRTGSFICVPSGLPGKLVAEGRRWKLSDGRHLAPLILPSGPFIRQRDTAGVRTFANWARKVAGARLIGTTLLNFAGEDCCTDSQEDRMYVDGEEGETFYLPVWDRTTAFYDHLRELGMGHYILIYSDDGSDPNKFGITGGSQAEERLFRYLVARFAPYPIVLWDSGIDIGETRSLDWIDRFVDWFHRNDPWKHPIGSRTGGGSGGKHPARGDYYSDGNKGVPLRGEFLRAHRDRRIPTAYTDRWRENGSRGGSRGEIRRAVWEAALSGGHGVYVAANEDAGYLRDSYASDLEVAHELGYAANFFEEIVDDFGALRPGIPVTQGATVAVAPGRELVGYSPSEGEVRIDLTDWPGAAILRHYNPLTGELSALVRISPQPNYRVPKAPFPGERVFWIHAATLSPSGGAKENPGTH